VRPSSFAAAGTTSSCPGAVPHEIDLRLRIRRPNPIRISTIIGDVLHNMLDEFD
jgi:hypothetical protein